MLTTMAKKRPHRRKPDSKRSQGVDRHTKPRLAFHLDRQLLDAMEQYIIDTVPRPSSTAVLVASLEAFLREKGYWPPKEQGEGAS